MGMFTYKDVPAELVPFTKPSFDLIRNEDRCAIFDFKNDLVVILDHTTPANGFIGTVQQAIDAGIISFTRATSAGRINAAGLYESVASGVWRRQYDPVTLQPLGYLPEPQRTNRVLQSSSLGTTWTATNATVTSDAAVGLDGTASMDKLAETSATGNHRLDQSVTLSSGANALSVVVKVGERTKGRLHIDGVISGVASGVDADFDLTAGTVVAASSGNITGAAATLRNLGGGRYRVLLTFTCSAVSSAAAIRLYNRDATGSTSYAGTTGAGLYWEHVQLEDGAYCSSIIGPTTVSAVTRGAEVMGAPLAKLPFGAAEGTVIEVAQPAPTTAASHVVWMMDDGTSSNRVFTASNINYSENAQLNSGGVPQANINTLVGVAAARYKAAVAWRLNDMELVVDGASLGTDNSLLVPVGMQSLRFGLSVTGSDASFRSSPIESIVYVPRRVPQAEMIARTAA